MDALVGHHHHHHGDVPQVPSFIPSFPQQSSCVYERKRRLRKASVFYINYHFLLLFLFLYY